MNINSENQMKSRSQNHHVVFLKNKLDVRSISIVGSFTEILVFFGSNVPLAARNHCNSTANTDSSFKRISYGELLYCTMQDK